MKLTTLIMILLAVLCMTAPGIILLALFEPKLPL
jgi:hypothetical protein